MATKKRGASRRRKVGGTIMFEVPEGETVASAWFEAFGKKHSLMGDLALEDLHLSRVDRHNRVIYVGGDPAWENESGETDEPGVEYLMADRFEINLHVLSTIDSKKPILVKLQSCGGNWEEGMQMFSAILHCPCPVTVLASKWARSMTSIIPLAADRFVIRPPAKYMYHRGTFSFDGLEQEFDSEDVERRRATEFMARLYALRMKESGGKYSRRSLHTLLEMVKENFRQKIDVWLTTEEAVEYGFADAVFDGDEKKLRAKSRNVSRREKLLELIREPINFTITPSPWKMANGSGRSR